MAKAAPKITLSPSRDIPFDQLLLSQSNVRRTRPGQTIGELADDIARRGLLQSLNARPELDGQGQETGRFEIPAGGRRFRALELLVKQKRLAKDAPIPCIVRAVDAGILAEDDSLAENLMRENLHPLDQFNGMRAMVEKGDDVEAIAAHYFTTPAVVRQRLKLASVSPMLHQVYADDEMSLDQLMAFTVYMPRVWGFRRAIACSIRRIASRASSAACGSGPATSSSQHRRKGRGTMSGLKVQYAESMVARIRAAIADGDKFSLRICESEKWIPSNRVGKVEFDAGTIIIDVRGGAKTYLRYDQIIRVPVGGPDD